MVTVFRTHLGAFLRQATLLSATECRCASALPEVFARGRRARSRPENLSAAAYGEARRDKRQRVLPIMGRRETRRDSSSEKNRLYCSAIACPASQTLCHRFRRPTKVQPEFRWKRRGRSLSVPLRGSANPSEPRPGRWWGCLRHRQPSQAEWVRREACWHKFC